MMLLFCALFLVIGGVGGFSIQRGGKQCVLYTGIEDMRVIDHPGLMGCANEAESWCAVLLQDAVVPKVTIIELKTELENRYGMKLQSACFDDVAKAAFDVIHVVESANIKNDLIKPWSIQQLREGTPDNTERFDNAKAWLKTTEIQVPGEAPQTMPLALNLFPPIDDDFITISDVNCDEPYRIECGCIGALTLLEEYLKPGGRVACVQKYLAHVKPLKESLYAAAAKWLAPSREVASARMAIREPAERIFSPALAVGALSKRQVANAIKMTQFPVDTLREVARSDAGALRDVIEWRDWHDYLKAKTQKSDQTIFWTRYSLAGYSIRYRYWQSHANKEHDVAFLFVHGFGANADQWERLAKAIHEIDKNAPPIYALDVLGFGFSAKPGLSYTQHLWEHQIECFAREIILSKHKKVILVGNSIGGGLSAGVSANLGRDKCAGLILCNSAGVILDKADFVDDTRDTRLWEQALNVRQRTLALLDDPKSPRTMPLEAFSPPPGGQVLLDAFGQLVIELLAPRIPSLLKRYYDINPDNADEKLAAAILRDARDPGAANVIGSGAKLPPQRSLNEVLGDFGGPVLVPQGEFDYVSGPERTRQRADQLAKIRPGVTVKLLKSGHCPHDETPDLVAQTILEWLASPAYFS